MRPSAPALAGKSKTSSQFHSLLGIENLPKQTILALLNLARRMQTAKSPPQLLRGRTIGLLFYEPSTRTRVSFELAAKRLGATTTLVSATASSIEKGESLLDTVATLRAAGVEALVLRHPSAGAPHLVARNFAAALGVINAGDGMHEHPTQALLDAYTILRHKKSLAGLRVAIIGDIVHSRVARSNAHLLTQFGARVIFCGPPELAPEVCLELAPGIALTRHLKEAVRGADVVMMLRVQKERLGALRMDMRKYVAVYQLTAERLQLARRDALVMHPGPMVRGMELADSVADGPQSVVVEQVANGVPVRMAALAWALGAAR